MSSLHRRAIQRPIRTIAIAAGLVLLAGLGVLRLEIRTDGRALAPEGAPALRVDDEIRAAFRVEEPLVVVVETDDARGVFNFATLAIVRDLTAALRALPGAGAVSSLAIEKSDRLGKRSLDFLPLLEPFPASDADLARLREEVHSIDVYTGTLVSFDARATALYVGIPEGGDREALVHEVQRLVAAADPGADRLHVIGAPAAEVLLGVHLLRDLGAPAFVLGSAEGRWGGLVPLAVGVMFLVFWAVFRSPLAALPPLIVVGSCTLAVLGIMGWCGVPIYLTTAVLPVILVALGLADEIHVFTRYAQLRRELPHEDAAELVAKAIDDKRAAVIQTSVTTAIGFASFLLTPTPAVRAFGAFTALGILLCLAWTLTVVPAMLVAVGPDRFLGKRRAGTLPALARMLETLARRAAARPRTVVAVAAALALLSFVGVARVRVQDGWISGFAAASGFRRATSAFEGRFLGTHRLLVCVDAGGLELGGLLEPADISHDVVRLPAGVSVDPAALAGCRLRVYPDAPRGGATDKDGWTTLVNGAHLDGGRLVLALRQDRGSPELMRRQWDARSLGFEITSQRMKQPEVLDRLRALEDFLAAQHDCSVGGVLGPVRYLETTSFLQAGRKEGSRSLPRDTFALESLWHNYGAVRGELRLRQAVDPSFSRALVDVYLRDANYVETAQLLERLRRFERESLAPAGLALSFSGDVATSQATIAAVVTTQVRSVLVSLAGSVLVVGLLARSLRLGILGVVPAVLSVLFSLGVMGALGVPLGVATSMFAAITLGIGVDYAIHFLHWLRRERGLGTADPIGAVVRATGPAILVDGATVALGFSVLAVSQVPANARLGLLLVASIATCLAATLVLLPALVSLRAGRSGAG